MAVSAGMSSSVSNRIPMFSPFAGKKTALSILLRANEMSVLPPEFRAEARHS